VRPIERRWIPDPAERERHETIVIQRLELDGQFDT